MITFTKEQLIASAHARIEFAEMMLAGELEPLKERTWSIELELARIALASLEAKGKIPKLSQVIYHFRDWNEGFPIERFKADYVISWMLANYPPSQPAPVVPDGYIMVPIEPTESMIIDGFESEPDEFFSKAEEWEAYSNMSGCEQAAHRAKLCWAAMLAAAPQQESV